MMAELRNSEPSNWVPEFEFEVWSLGIDCKKFYAQCCRDLAGAAVKEQDRELLNARAQKLELEAKELSDQVNYMLDLLLGDFYASGGKSLPGCLAETTRRQVRDCLDEIDAFELMASQIVTTHDFNSAVGFAEKQEHYYNEFFKHLAELYPEGAIKNALVQISA